MARLRMILLGAALLVAGCGGGQDQAQTEQEAAPEPQTPEASQPAAAPAPETPAEPETAPDQFSVVFETSAGDFTVSVERRLAPHGADRLYQLVKSGFYDDQRFYRVVPGFVVQWGMAGDPAIIARWSASRIPDDPVVGTNLKGTVTFAAGSQPGTRTTQLFVNLRDNTNLDGMGFAPIGRVTEGMEVVEAINGEYGESPNQMEIRQGGNEYLNREFPRLDYIRTARIVQ